AMSASTNGERRGGGGLGAERDQFAKEFVLPVWDPDSRWLWFDDSMIKAYCRQASGQMAVLDAFEAAGWDCRRVARPLRQDDGETEAEYRERLRYTVKNLNKGLQPGTICFAVDRRGDGVRWGLCPGHLPRKLARKQRSEL